MREQASRPAQTSHLSILLRENVLFFFVERHKRLPEKRYNCCNNVFTIATAPGKTSNNFFNKSKNG
jgi:hypothetical protein